LPRLFLGYFAPKVIDMPKGCQNSTKRAIAMAYTWTEELATGVEAIDTQHKQLINALNDLIDACFSGQGHAQLDPTIQFLVDYTSKHFGDEEKLQQQCGYPGYLHHKKLHEAFKATVGELAERLKMGKVTAALVREVNSSIGFWLINHIKGEDKKIAAHIRNNS
jgi:hemerythrin